MATEAWITVGTKYCEYIDMKVELRELRLYSADFLPSENQAGYRVLERHCTGAIPCNMAGIPCEWAFNNPGVDKFNVT